MRFGSKKNQDTVAGGHADADSVGVDNPPLRANGPWDVSEKASEQDPTYIDLGSLIVKGDTAFKVQLPTDGESTEIGSVVLMTEDSGLEMRAFAAPRSGGLWDEVRSDLITEVQRLEGELDEVDGVFGSELRIKVPVELPDGEAGFQPSRILAVEGPRWMLRATFLGDAGLNPSDEGLLVEAFRNTIVVRGQEPKAPRDPLLLTVPEGAVVEGADEDA